MDSGVRSKSAAVCRIVWKQVWLVLSGEIKKSSHRSGQLVFIEMHYQGRALDNSLISATQTLSDNVGEREHVVQHLELISPSALLLPVPELACSLPHKEKAASAFTYSFCSFCKKSKEEGQPMMISG